MLLRRLPLPLPLLPLPLLLSPCRGRRHRRGLLLLHDVHHVEGRRLLLRRRRRLHLRLQRRQLRLGKGHHVTGAGALRGVGGPTGGRQPPVCVCVGGGEIGQLRVCVKTWVGAGA